MVGTIAAVAIPEQIEQFLVAGDSGIKIERYRFSVIAEIVIGRVLLLAAAVADACAKDSVEAPKLGVRSPKSSYAEGGSFVGDLSRVAIQGKALGGYSSVLWCKLLVFGCSEDCHGDMD